MRLKSTEHVIPNIEANSMKRYLPFLLLTSLTLEFLSDSRHEAGCQTIHQLLDAQWRTILVNANITSTTLIDYSCYVIFV